MRGANPVGWLIKIKSLTITKEQKTVLISIGVIICILITSAYISGWQEKSLAKNGKIIYGKVGVIERFPKSDRIRIWYAYQVNNKENTTHYTLNVDVSHIRRIRSLLENKTLPVLYDTTETDFSILPLLKKDFKQYKIHRDASLYDLYQAIDSLKIIP